MQILVENGAYGLQNMGDVAMLQVGVRRLQRLFPGAAVRVMTARPDLLARFCPGALPVDPKGREEYADDGAVLGRHWTKLPRFEERLRDVSPRLVATLASLRGRVHGRRLTAIGGFLDALLGADLVVATGGGYVTDPFPGQTTHVLRTLELAIRLGTPAAMLGQGLGPLTKPPLVDLASRVLPRLALITLREQTGGVPLLRELGVPETRYVLTGDDAIELAYQDPPAPLGDGIGVNMRTAYYAEVDDGVADTFRGALADALARHGARAVPVPISFLKDGEDVRAIGRLIGDTPAVPPDGWTPTHTVDAARQCRVVVTGAYHAAVFALSAGIPAIGLASSDYYAAKFNGLRDGFGGDGCRVVRTTGDWATTLRAEIDRAWDTAPTLRPALLDAAKRQIAAQDAAYARLPEVVG